METMEQQRRRLRRSFSDEFKQKVVEFYRTSGRSIPEIARDLDLAVTAVWRWVAQVEIGSGRRPGTTTDEHDEFVRLRNENRVLREERDIFEALRRVTLYSVTLFNRCWG